MIRSIRVATLVAALIVSGCNRSAGTANAAEPAQNAPGAAADTAQPVPAQLPDVLARVNGEAVTKTEFDRAVQALEARAGQPVPEEQRDQILRGVLEQIIGYKLLLQESQARKVTVADGDVDARVAEIREQFPDEAAFTRMLGERQLTLEQVRSDARQDMAIQQLIETEVTQKSAVTAEQLNDFYTKNPDQFQQQESVHASHILIGTPRDADAAAKAKARTQAEQVLAEVRSGKDFAELARQHSSDPGSAANGGDLGVFQQGQMVGPFNDAAFTLAPGAISDLVETEFGYHIIKVIEKTPARTVPLDEVRPQLEQYLQQVNRQQQTDAFVKGLRAKGTVEVLI